MNDKCSNGFCEFDSHTTTMNIQNIINKVYPIIAKDYNSNAKVELYSDIYERLDSTPAIEEYESYAEYSWSDNKIINW